MCDGMSDRHFVLEIQLSLALHTHTHENDHTTPAAELCGILTFIQIHTHTQTQSHIRTAPMIVSPHTIR